MSNWSYRKAKRGLAKEKWRLIEQLRWSERMLEHFGMLGNKDKCQEWREEIRRLNKEIEKVVL